jgi:hypothetical protein
MPNITVPNFQYAALSDGFSGIWKLTRAMKAAGWRYKSSSDGTTKESGTSNPNNDKWGGGVQVGSQTATAAFTIGSPTSTKEMGRVTVSGLTGFSASGGLSLSGSIGRFLKITGATNSANNGTWQIVKVNSATSVDVVNPAAVSETTPGTATWTELDALLDTYPAAINGASGPGAWWNAQGPSMMKIPIGGNTTTGNFYRGENVTQDNTGATGEILGVIMDFTGGAAGFIVVAPRNSGSGSGQRGWSSTDVIRAASAPTGSGASVTPTSAALEFGQEIVIWKTATPLSGHIYIQCIDLVNESTSSGTNGRFSVMAALGTCTATICPGGATGGAPTSNGFPTTGTMVLVGTGGSGANGTGLTQWHGNNLLGTNITTNVLTMCHLMVANCIETSGQSGDGSFTLAEGTAGASGTSQSYDGFGWIRCDDQEDGDVWPYAWMSENLFSELYTGSRTAASVYASSPSLAADYFRLGSWFGLGDRTLVRGWRRRGFGTGDAFQQCFGATLGVWNGATLVSSTFNGSPDRVACTFAGTSAQNAGPIVREPIWIVSTQVNSKMRKGTLRWWFAQFGGNGNGLLSNKTYVQLSGDQTSTGGPVSAGPWDGVSVPYNS